MITLENRLYTIGTFAKRAGVTIRTLRFYDGKGLLPPTSATGAGYRLYAERDLVTLQSILALKYLGLSLEDIRRCLRGGPAEVGEILARQHRLLEIKRGQLDAVLNAVGAAEKLASAGTVGGDALIEVIKVMQMDNKQEWVGQYLSEDQVKKLAEIADDSYSTTARVKLAARAWSAEDQERVSAQWTELAKDASRLAAAGADPAGPEAQALAKRKSDLLFAFTQGDPEITAGLKTFWEKHSALPGAEQPLARSAPTAVIPGSDDPGAQLLDRAMEVFRGRQSGSKE